MRRVRARLTARRLAWLRQLAVSPSVRAGWGRVGADCWHLGWSRWQFVHGEAPGQPPYEVITAAGLAVLALADEGAECTAAQLAALLPGSPA